MSGTFISIEGTEGVGKSTNIAFIKSFLEQKHLPVTLTREPGGTPFAEEVREMLLRNRDEQVSDKAELLMIFAARCQHVANTIMPAIAKGEWVVSDRFTDASFAYQGYGRNLGHECVAELERWALGSFKPDLTLFFDLPPEQGLERAKRRAVLDRFESEKLAFFNRVRAGYLKRAEDDPTRMKIIDASGSIEEVQRKLAEVLTRFVEQRLQEQQTKKQELDG